MTVECEISNDMEERKAVFSLLTTQFVLGTSNHVVEDVKSSFCLCLSDTARLLQQV